MAARPPTLRRGFGTTSLKKPQAGSPPSSGQPPLAMAASWMVCQLISPNFFSSTAARLW